MLTQQWCRTFQIIVLISDYGTVSTVSPTVTEPFTPSPIELAFTRHQTNCHPKCVALVNKSPRDFWNCVS